MTKNRIAIFAIALLVSACGKQKRDFFYNMSDHFEDVEVDSQFYFIKSFGLSPMSTKINGIDYWALKNDEKSYFKLQGYLRRLNDSIMLVPFNNKGGSGEEKLFDFREKKGETWKVTLKTTEYYNSGDSVLLSNITKISGDTIYLYRLRPFIFYKKNQKEEYYGPIFNLEVSRHNGLISITKLKAGRPGFDYKAILYPKQSFIKDKHIMFDL